MTDLWRWICLSLVRMKLTSNRPIDHVHIADMVDVGLIDDGVRSSLPAELQTRLAKIKAAMDE